MTRFILMIACCLMTFVLVADGWAAEQPDSRSKQDAQKSEKETKKPSQDAQKSDQPAQKAILVLQLGSTVRRRRCQRQAQKEYPLQHHLAPLRSTSNVPIPRRRITAMCTNMQCPGAIVPKVDFSAILSRIVPVTRDCGQARAPLSAKPAPG